MAVISRDRGQAYVEGASMGAPDAVQTADRWHIAKNLGEAVERYLTRCLGMFQHAVSAGTSERSSLLPAAGETLPPVGASDGASDSLTPPQRLQEERHARRHARWADVHTCHARGMSITTIAQQIGLDRKTVCRYLRTTAALVRRRRQRRGSCLDPFVAYLHQQWAGGCRNGRWLFRQIVAQGYTGGRSLVSTWIAQMRRTQGLPPGRRQLTSPEGPTQPTPVPLPSPRQMAALFLRRPSDLTVRQNAVVQRVCVAEEGTTLYQLVQEFMTMLRERRGQELDQWITGVQASGLRELSVFAAGIATDPAVRAGLTLPWSNGPVEGFVNKLKMLKRQMFGRAKVDLLQRRMVLDGQGSAQPA